MPADPRAAGRKGGLSRAAKKKAASRRNGFQPNEPLSESEQRLRDLNVKQWLADAKLLGVSQDLIDSIAEKKASGEIKDAVASNGDAFPHPINLAILVAKKNLENKRPLIAQQKEGK